MAKVDSALATVSILVIYNALQIAPSISIPRRGGYTYTFVPSGGVGTYTYSMASGSGSVDASGVYTAGTTGATATLRVTDSLGNTADSTVNLVYSFTNGAVSAQAVDSSGNLYLGGSFTGVFPYSAPRALALNTVSGAPELSFDLQAGFNGEISAIVQDPTSGAIYVGGSFTSYRGVAANNIAKLDSYGSLDTSFYPSSGTGGFNSVVKTLALNSTGTTLYVGGGFSTYRGVADSARYIAKLSTSNGAIDTTFHPVSATGGFDSSVTTLALNSTGTTLYVGGYFTAYRGVTDSARRIAKLATSDGAIHTTFHPVSASGGFGSGVNTLALNSTGTTLYVGGWFGIYRGVDDSVYGIAKLSTSDGAIDTTFQPALSGGFSGGVYSLTLNSTGATLYVGGEFIGYRGVDYSANFIAKLSTSDGAIYTIFHPVSATGGFNNIVSALTLNSSGNTLYVGGGEFSTYEGGLCISGAQLDPANGALLLP